MQFLPTLDYVSIHPTVQTELYNAVEALRVADAKLQLASDAYDEDDEDGYSLDKQCIEESQFTARLFAALLQEIVTGVPTIPDRVFHAMRDFVNIEEENIPHLEGATLALQLAHESIQSAMYLSAEHDGIEYDDVYRLMMVAFASIESRHCLLDGSTVGGWWRDDLLAAMLADKPIEDVKRKAKAKLHEIAANAERYRAERLAAA